MNSGFVKQKLFDSIQPNETNIQEQSQTICLELRLCPCVFVSLGWTGSKSFCFTNPEFIHFSLSKLPKSGPYFKKVKKAHVHLIRLTFCVIFFVAEKLWNFEVLRRRMWPQNFPNALNIRGGCSNPAISTENTVEKARYLPFAMKIVIFSACGELKRKIIEKLDFNLKIYGYFKIRLKNTAEHTRNTS